jgi:hypothetical protein
VHTPVEHCERATGQRLSGRARNEDLVCASGAHDARRRVDVESADFFATILTRTGVDASPAAQTERADGMFDRERAANCRARGFEECEESVTRGVDFASVASLQGTPDNGSIAG